MEPREYRDTLLILRKRDALSRRMAAGSERVWPIHQDRPPAFLTMRVLFARGDDGGVTYSHRHSRQVRRRTLNWNPEVCVSKANTYVDVTVNSRALGARYVWFPDRRTARAAFVRDDGADLR